MPPSRIESPYQDSLKQHGWNGSAIRLQPGRGPRCLSEHNAPSIVPTLFSVRTEFCTKYKGWQGTRKTGGSGEKGPFRSFLAHFERISWWHRCLTLRISWYWHEATHKQRKAHPKVSKWSHTIKIGYAERWILSILRAPPCRKFDADGKGVGCVIDYMTISEDTDI